MGKSGDAPKQQSTLSFKTPTAGKQDKPTKGKIQIVKRAKEEEEDEDVVTANGDGKGTIKTEDSNDRPTENIKPSVNDNAAPSTDQGNGSNHPRPLAIVAYPLRSLESPPENAAIIKQEENLSNKRTKAVVEEAENEEDDDEEPVRKRPRRSVQNAKPSHKDRSDHPPTSKIAEKPTTKAAATAPVFHRQGANEKLAQGKITNSSNTSKTAEKATLTTSRKIKEDANDEEEDPEDENEDDDDEAEEEKPEVAKKKREKVQSTLSSQEKDPYPDWKPGEPVPYAALCTTFSLVEMTTKRLIISAHCSAFLRQVLRLTPQDLLPTIQLMINKLAADYAGIELGIGESLIMKAIGESTGRSLAVIKADQSTIGDLGLVAVKSRSNQKTMFKPKPLTVKGVLDGLMSIATIQGGGSQGQKIAGIRKLLSSADLNLKSVDITKDKGGASEAKFIVRFLEGKLRLGLAEKTVLVALAHAMVFHETTAKGNKVPSSDQLAKGESILKTVYR